jgi:DNA-binding beta-propeller fold protein YncE
MGTLRYLGRACAIAVPLLLALSTAADAPAATNLSQVQGPAGCVTEADLGGQCEDGRGLVGSNAIAFSPDEQNAYVASATFDSVSILTLQADGSLAQVPSPTSCFDSLEAVYTDCDNARQLGGASDVAVSPDGANVYVAAPDDSAVVIFDRDPGTGALSLSAAPDGCVNADGSNSCVAGRALIDSSAVVISPDGKNAYVASEGVGSGVAIFDRNTETGDLTQKAGTVGCVNDSGANGCTDGPAGVLGAIGLAISADGKFVYVASASRDAVTIYSRDGSSGELTPIAAPAGCITDGGIGGCQSAVALGDPAAITLTPDGQSAYVASERRDAILVFGRDPVSGGLIQKPGTSGCISDSGRSDPLNAGTAGACQDGVALDGVSSVAVLPDGSAAYATTAKSDGVVVLERDPSGELKQRPGPNGCWTETGFEVPGLPWTQGYCEDGRALREARAVVTSSDGRHVYTIARQGGVASFDVVEAATPGPREETPVTPPSTGPSGTACKQARAAQRRVERKLDATLRDVRLNAGKARRAETLEAKRRYTRVVRRLLRKVGQLQKERHRRTRIARNSCH